MMKVLLRKIQNAGQYAQMVGRYGWPSAGVHFGHAPGDDLLCTALAHEMKKRGERAIWMFTNHPGIFEGNPNVRRALKPRDNMAGLLKAAGRRFIHPVYAEHDWKEDRDPIPEQHIITMMCRRAGLTGSVALRTYMYLTQEEKARGRIRPGQIAIQSSGLGAKLHMANKEWFPERFQKVIDALKAEYLFVQIGTQSDPPLEGAIDMRGKTTLREAAGILSQSALFVGLAGAMQHMARAMETRSVIVYGGREHPSQTGYPCNLNIIRTPPCAPCWYWNTCAHARKCMAEISAEEVIEAVREGINRTGEELETAIETISEEPSPLPKP